MFDRCTLDEVVAALAHLPADERETWVRMGMAIHHEFGADGFDTWDAWSQSAGNYNARAARDTFKSFKARGGGITIATLFEAAIKAGYQPEKKQLTAAECQRLEAERLQRAAARQAREQIEAQMEAQWQDGIATLAEELLQNHLESFGKSPYLGRKKIKPFGARFVPHGIVVLFGSEDEPSYQLFTGRAHITAFFNDRDPERSFLYLKPGYLVVPLLDAGGYAWNLQVITETGKKLFLKRGRKSGLSYVIGEISPGAPVVFVEGFATGASVHMATGYPVVVCLDAGNLPVVVAIYRERLRTDRNPFVIAGDNDVYTTGNPGLAKATQAANSVGGVAVVPEFKATVNE